MKSWLDMPIPISGGLPLASYLAQSFAVIPLLLLPFLLLAHHTGNGPSQSYIWVKDKPSDPVNPHTIVWHAELNNQRLLLKIPQPKSSNMLTLQQAVQPTKEEKKIEQKMYQHLYAYLLDLRQRFGTMDLLQLGVDGAVSHGLVQEITTMVQQIFHPHHEYSEQNKIVVYCSTCN